MRLVSVRELTSRDLAAWNELGRSSLEPNPLSEPGCVVPAARHLPYGANIAVVLAEDADRVVGALPVRVRTRWQRIETLTNDVRRMTYLGTPLLAADGGTPAVARMLWTLARRRRESVPGLLELKWLHAGGPVHESVHDALVELGMAVDVAESFDRPFVLRRASSVYDDHFNSKYRAVLKRRRRQMGEALGGEPSVRDRADDPSAVHTLIDLEARGYKGRTGVALAAAAGETESFSEMAAAFAAEGRLQLLSLEAAGTVAAMQLSVRGGDGLFALKVAYDETLARFGPGVQLQLGSIDHFHRATTSQWIDSCTYGGNETLLRLYPDRRPIVSYLVALGGVAETSLVRALPTLRALRRRVRSARRMSGVSPAPDAAA